MQSLGDGNWKMGEGVQVGKGGKSGETDERTLIEHYLREPFNASPLNL